MAYLDSTSLVWLTGLIQIAGLASAWLARLTEGSRRQAACQWLFFVCLALVGLTVLGLVSLGVRYWLFSAGTMATMILGAIWDFRVPSPVNSLRAYHS